MLLLAVQHLPKANSGDIRGTVTDATGAVIPGVTVTVLTSTKVSPPLCDQWRRPIRYWLHRHGPLHSHVHKEDFGTFVGPVTLQVQTLTIDASLPTGAAAQTVRVTTDAPLLETESGAQSTTLPANELNALPNFGVPSWESFTILMPGASGTPSNGLSNVDPGQAVSVNGNATYYNVLADGNTGACRAAEMSKTTTLTSWQKSRWIPTLSRHNMQTAV